MPRYRVAVRVEIIKYYKVTAETEDDAVEKVFQQGIDTQCEETVPEWYDEKLLSVEELDDNTD